MLFSFPGSPRPGTGDSMSQNACRSLVGHLAVEPSRCPLPFGCSALHIEPGRGVKAHPEQCDHVGRTVSSIAAIGCLHAVTSACQRSLGNSPTNRVNELFGRLWGSGVTKPGPGDPPDGRHRRHPPVTPPLGVAHRLARRTVGQPVALVACAGARARGDMVWLRPDTGRAHRCRTIQKGRQRGRRDDQAVVFDRVDGKNDPDHLAFAVQQGPPEFLCCTALVSGPMGLGREGPSGETEVSVRWAGRRQEIRCTSSGRSPWLSSSGAPSSWCPGRRWRRPRPTGVSGVLAGGGRWWRVRSHCPVLRLGPGRQRMRLLPPDPEPAQLAPRVQRHRFDLRHRTEQCLDQAATFFGRGKDPQGICWPDRASGGGANRQSLPLTDPRRQQ